MHPEVPQANANLPEPPNLAPVMVATITKSTVKTGSVYSFLGLLKDGKSTGMIGASL